MKQYTVKEVSELLGVNPRAVQKRCVRANLDMTKGVYLIPENIFEKWVAKKERTSNMRIVRTSTLEKENNVRSRALNTPDYASISKRPLQDNKEIQSLQDEITELRKALSQHNRLFSFMEKKGLLDDNVTPPTPLKTYKNVEVERNVEVENDVEDFKTSAEWYKSVHPEGKEIKNDKGEVIDIQPSMNDVNFQSSYNYHKKPNKE